VNPNPDSIIEYALSLLKSCSHKARFCDTGTKILKDNMEVAELQ